MLDSIKDSAYWPALRTQLIHLLLAIIWNLIGVVFLLLNKPALGPTASLVSVLVMLLLAGSLILGATRTRVLYIVTSLIIFAACLSTIYNAIVSDPALWPNDLVRYGGMLINSIGVVGAIWAVRLSLTK